MSEILLGLLAISGLAAFLALLLEVADSYLADYGERHILVNDEKDLIVKGGRPLLFSMSEKGIFLPSACGGKGTCGYCKIRVMEGGGPLLPTETPFLNQEEQAEQVRISCQLKVKEDLKVEIPEELFLVKVFRVRVERIRALTPDIKEVRLTILEPAEGITFKAGQYVQLEIPAYARTQGPEFRAYSIASPTDSRHFVELIITRVEAGVVSTYVHDFLKEGDELTLRGPFGEFYLQDSDREIVMIATGSGLAPFRAMLAQLRESGSGRKVTLFFGDRRPFDLLYYEELLELERVMDNFTYIPTLSRITAEDHWPGDKGRVTDLIQKNIPDNAPIDVYICGAPVMVQSCFDLLTAKGIQAEHIWYDKFD
jgi:Na+-transporting NADH:ubiquinone oxidoreductase subunit F